MIWRIPIVFEMTGFQLVEADRLEDAMTHACDSFNPCDTEFKEGSLELDCADVESVRMCYNSGRPDGLETEYPELAHYELTYRTRDIYWEDDGSEDADAREYRIARGMSQYSIIFDVAGARYSCIVEALSISEALGIFFQENPHITYDMVVDHMEV